MELTGLVITGEVLIEQPQRVDLRWSTVSLTGEMEGHGPASLTIDPDRTSTASIQSLPGYDDFPARHVNSYYFDLSVPSLGPALENRTAIDIVDTVMVWPPDRDPGNRYLLVNGPVPLYIKGNPSSPVVATLISAEVVLAAAAPATNWWALALLGSVLLGAVAWWMATRRQRTAT